jgi:hypothetical protein
MDLFQKTKLSVMKKRGIVFIAVGFIGSTEMKMTRAVLELMDLLFDVDGIMVEIYDKD